MKCKWCTHERHYHFVINLDGDEDEQPCAFFYGSGKWRCRCDSFEEAAHASA